MPWRIQESELYKNLGIDDFCFIEAGRRHMSDIKEAVRNRYPDLCDDEFLCINCCEKGSRNPEWHHIIRASLGIQKNKITSRVREDNDRGYWIFLM